MKKIDESCINHNALRIIDDIIGEEPCTWINDSKSTVTACTIGEVYGVLRMAGALKEVLKT